MPPIQTAYNDRPAAYAKGRRVNMEEWNAFTGIAAAEGIGIAEPVQDGTDGEEVVPFTSGTFRGITEWSPETGEDAVFPEGANVPVTESGVIAGTAYQTCTKRTPVYWNAANKGYTSTVGTNTLIPNAEFDATVSAGELVPIRLRRIPPAPAA
ncbi:MAG: hypothetical protein VX569_11130 [Pseudomonadota bacterium]|nr:hypothetical protein [Pseudomonadota bacterium]